MLARTLVLCIRVYQVVISPWLGPVCRFEPSCSRYAVTCLERHGAIRGSWLALLRLLRCHPFHPGGYDPPPPVRGAPTKDEAVAQSPNSGNDNAPTSQAEPQPVAPQDLTPRARPRGNSLW